MITARKTGIDEHETAEMHRPMLDPLEARDPERAGATLRRHVEHLESC